MADENWNEIVKRVQAREAAVEKISAGLGPDYFSSSEISATDIFVEKAQMRLEQRSKSMLICACLSIFASIMIIVFSIYGLIKYYPDLQIRNPNGSDLTTQYLVAGIVRNASILGFILGGLYFSISLFRAFIHEATILNNRVHSLRLGRLFIYIKYASIDGRLSLNQMRHKITAGDLEQVFGWNIETSTAFKDIQPEFATKTLWGTLGDAIGKAIPSKDKG